MKLSLLVDIKLIILWSGVGNMSEGKLKKLFTMPYLLLVLNALCLLVVLVLVFLKQTFVGMLTLGIVNILFGIVVITTDHCQIFKAKSKLFDSIFLFCLGVSILLFSILVFIVPDLPLW